MTNLSKRLEIGTVVILKIPRVYHEENLLGKVAIVTGVQTRGYLVKIGNRDGLFVTREELTPKQ
jgi:hypothetical protein